MHDVVLLDQPHSHTHAAIRRKSNKFQAKPELHLYASRSSCVMNEWRFDLNIKWVKFLHDTHIGYFLFGKGGSPICVIYSFSSYHKERLDHVCMCWSTVENIKSELHTENTLQFRIKIWRDRQWNKKRRTKFSSRSI